MSNILIVGGSSGIGLATVELFFKNNHKVTIASRHADKLNLAGVNAISLDFLDDNNVKSFFEVWSDFDSIIITATTPLAMGPFLSIDLIDARKSFDKFWGITNIIHYAAQYSKNLKSITVVSGAAADKRGAPITFLAATSTAINVLVESLAVELAPLRINAISPGLTETPLYGETSRETLQDWANASPLKRLAIPIEIAEAIHFVTLHPQMTGAVISVDGGSRLVSRS
ncbi:MAG: hypothetical protein A3F17_08490 [Gammaproteobacteria bacterium RIFCSPHIGHO2_12_FULL_41_15]|nr:MAG: hypothetical protein A3F17_08490 [Gammaproteobacteria bacterium RIFCSPHIGHO2_12_FULL_41_15]